MRVSDLILRSIAKRCVSKDEATEPKTLYGFRKHRPIVGEVPHFAPSGAPPLGQNTETNVSFASQLAAPSDWTDLTVTGAASPLSPFSPGAP